MPRNPPQDGQAQVESFRVDPRTGALTEVSILVLPGSGTVGGDVHVAADGQEVYVTTTPLLFGEFTLAVLTVGSGCRLTLANSQKASYYAIALVGNAGLFAVDTFDNLLDLYHIRHGTQLTLISSTTSQVLYPLGAASG
jgi:hypothetical protein